MTMAEWSSARAPVDSLTAEDRELADALRTADGGRVLVDERHDSVWVTTRSWIGVVRFPSFELNIVPKLASSNVAVAQMLAYASGIGALRRLKAPRELETVGDDLLELIIWLFADASERIVSDGLLSDYVGREDSLHVLRGRLRLLDQVQRQYGRVDPLEVAFDEFETDISENRILAAALSTIRSVVRWPDLQRRVRRLHSILDEATDITGADPLRELEDLVYTRRNAHYEGAHVLARLLLRRLAVRDLLGRGTTNSFAFLLDMNELFEAFVARLVAEAFEPRGIRVHSQRRDPSIIIDESTGGRYAAIIPDLMLEVRRGASTIRLPIDSKYKLYDQRKLNEGDVYQTFFYAFAYASDRRSGRPARAVILYPRAGDGEDTALRIDTSQGRQSARISAFGVDIDAALDAVNGGALKLGSVPAVAKLAQVFAQVVADEEVTWLAS